VQSKKTSRGVFKRGIDMITKLNEEEAEHLKLAIQLSDLSATRPYGENHPFGAVIVLKNGTLIKGHNHVTVDNDPTQHAELYTVSQACRSGLTANDFEGATLYTSTEPCAMCCGAIHWAGIRRVVYACSNDHLNELLLEMFPERTESGGLLMSSREVFGQCRSRIDVFGPFLEEEAIAIHKKHWPRLLGVPVPTAWQSTG
jgi:tRNA(Arg) A34 adenosine deaminase TadA